MASYRKNKGQHNIGFSTLSASFCEGNRDTFWLRTLSFTPLVNFFTLFMTLWHKLMVNFAFYFFLAMSSARTLGNCLLSSFLGRDGLSRLHSRVEVWPESKTDQISSFDRAQDARYYIALSSFRNPLYLRWGAFQSLLLRGKVKSRAESNSPVNTESATKMPLRVLLPAPFPHRQNTREQAQL